MYLQNNAPVAQRQSSGLLIRGSRFRNSPGTPNTTQTKLGIYTRMKCTHAQAGISLVERDGRIMPCCRYKNQNDLLSIWDVDSLNDLSMLGPYAKINESLIDGRWPDGCSRCKREEEAGLISRRMDTNELFSSFPDVNAPGRLQDLEIGLDFTCNMMCRSCNPHSSSRWGAAKQLLRDLSAVGAGFDNEDGSYRSYADRFRQVMDKTDLSFARIVKVEGGEPFYSKNLQWFLDKLSREVIQREHLRLMIFTNGSIFPDQSIIDKLSELNTILVFSLDAVGGLANTMRWGIDWSIIDANIRRWKDHDLKKQSNITVSLLNVNKMQSLIDYCREIDVHPSFDFLTSPRYLSVYQFGPEIRKSWCIESQQVFNDKLMANISFDQEFQTTISAMSLLDQYQSIKFSDHNPEMHDLLLLMTRRNTD